MNQDAKLRKYQLQLNYGVWNTIHDKIIAVIIYKSKGVFWHCCGVDLVDCTIHLPIFSKMWFVQLKCELQYVTYDLTFVEYFNSCYTTMHC